MISKRELDAIVTDSRRDLKMADYIADNGGEFIFDKHIGWSYKPEQVIYNQLEKLDRRAEKKESTIKKRNFLKLRR